MKKTVLWMLALLIHPGVQAASDLNAGKVLFTQRCGNCHSVGPAARSGFGPHLNGLFGRRAGALKDYNYSPAMQTSDVVWTRETVTAFLADPDEVVPGTKMRFWGISDKQRVEKLLDYLELHQ
ncbi:cytochrome c [Pseudomonas duriflava]|uniref:Cytochrome c n=1 Tax=Pseudomonas duriflava TaxID=459528 RepID=A0A562QKY9_9PSED|nr:c-type cytochrome [Pseudomonas duriflava]TWI57427.1 cytochrome c [Pseudomonas duriflava]